MSPDGSLGFGMLLAIFIAYMLPALIATLRLHHNAIAIIALNILLGWSVIGWIIAFVWSLTAKRAAN